MKTICVYDPKTKTVKTIPMFDNQLCWVIESKRPEQINPAHGEPSCPVQFVPRAYLPDEIKNLGRYDQH